MAKAVRSTLETLSWEVLPHAAYSPDLAPSDYHFFASMGHALAEQRFSSYEDVKKNLLVVCKVVLWTIILCDNIIRKH